MTVNNAEASAVAARVDMLRRTMLKPDNTAFDDLLDDALSYGHTTGLVETKADMIAVLTSGRTRFTSLDQPEQTITVTGDIATVRHRFNGECVNDDKPGSPRIRVIQVWRKDNGRWRLLARQGF